VAQSAGPSAAPSAAPTPAPSGASSALPAASVLPTASASPAPSGSAHALPPLVPVELPPAAKAFDAAARAAGKPFVPEGWKPRPRERVVVQNKLNGDYSEATIESVRPLDWRVIGWESEVTVCEGVGRLQSCWNATEDAEAVIAPVPTQSPAVRA